jgi:hypothetical protein
MKKMMYLAAQYLSAAAISFLEKKDDDSHTNLGFSVEDGSLYSRPLNDNGDNLSLNYKNFSLEWNTLEESSALSLNGTTHAEVLDWLARKTSKSGFSSVYNYTFHYDLPYKIDQDFIFRYESSKRLKELLEIRILTERVLHSFLEEHQLSSEIRVWPHHFDTGGFVRLDDGSGKSVGFGLAVPDSVCTEHYFYMSGYIGHNFINTAEFEPLSRGIWKVEDYKAAVLGVSEVDEKTALNFFNEAFSAIII